MRFLEYLNEAIKNDPKLKKMYDKFNQELFLKVLGRSLPEDLVVGWTTAKKSVGKASATKNNTTGQVTPERIVISKNFDLSEDQLKGILVHEMVHIYDYIVTGKSTHGSKFYKTIDELQKYVNFNIPYKESEATFTPQKTNIRGLLLMRMGDKRRIVVWLEKFFKNNVGDLFSKYHSILERRYRDIEIYGGFYESSILEKYPVKRSSPKGKIPFYGIDKNEYEEVKKNMKVISKK